MSESTTKAILLPNSTIKDQQSKIIPLYKTPNASNSQFTSSKIVTKLCLNTLEGSMIIPFTDILRLESSSNYTSLYTIDSKKYVFSKTMKTFIDLLPTWLFIRCHRSHFVNINQIVSFKKGSLILQDNIEIPIARQKYKDVERSIKSICATI